MTPFCVTLTATVPRTTEGEMEDSRAGEFPRKKSDADPKTEDHERRVRPRSEGVIGRIEDITYAVLRKHLGRPA